MANADAGSADSGMKGAGDKDSRTSGVPASFVVHMILVAVGVVFVIVYSTMEPAVSFVQSDNMFGAFVLK